MTYLMSTTPTLEDQIKIVKREIALREKVYPRQVDYGRMDKEEADRELGGMKGVLETLEGLTKGSDPKHEEALYGLASQAFAFQKDAAPRIMEYLRALDMADTEGASQLIQALKDLGEATTAYAKQLGIPTE